MPLKHFRTHNRPVRTAVGTQEPLARYECKIWTTHIFALLDQISFVLLEEVIKGRASLWVQPNDNFLELG